MVMNGSGNISLNAAVQGQADERSLRRYTAEEDERILQEWWQKEKRSQLMRDLGRTKAALAQRYYLLLREMGITPEDHRRQQLQAQIQGEGTGSRLDRRERVTSAPASVANHVNSESWTPEREAFLWRQARSGTSFEEIAEVLGGVTPGECRVRYMQMLQGRQGTAVDTVNPVFSRPSGSSGRDADGLSAHTGGTDIEDTGSESMDSEGELWATLAALPERLERLETEQSRMDQRLAALEAAWSGLAAALQGVARAIPVVADRVVTSGGRTVQESTQETAVDKTMPLIRELGQSLQAFLRLGHWDKIRQLPAFLSSLDEKLQQLEERVAGT